MPRTKKGNVPSGFSHHKTKKTANRHARSLRNKGNRVSVKKVKDGYDVLNYKK
jgi:hypothetical protein